MEKARHEDTEPVARARAGVDEERARASRVAASEGTWPLLSLGAMSAVVRLYYRGERYMSVDRSKKRIEL